jgi:hypothetical protein
MEFITMFSQNGKELIVLNNFKFKFKYESKINGNQTWEYTKKTRKAKLIFTRKKLYYKKNQFWIIVIIQIL